MSWSIDQTIWDIPCSIERTSEMTSSEISGLMLDKSYFNDVIGTYMKYSLKLIVPVGWEQKYVDLYKILTEPVDGHQFQLPYDGGVLAITGRIENVKDVYVRMPSGKTHWKGISFDVIANHPSREMKLSEVINRGAAPLPDESDVVVGATYNYTVQGWTTIDSGEDRYY